MRTWTVLKDLVKKNCLIKNVSLVQQKKGKIGDNGKKLDGHINNEDYLMWLSQSLFEKKVFCY